ncbi:helix-turn-helix domain-containing protein [Anaerospora sp.]|uniref:helix-turn-helix domain-containing protein n=1 Tax=Anaerospora sp. TaxID=1960278 RepID=UPI0028A0E1EC|nr:helix-turn-helix domain-containing protein [Anaerospora sp.]
MIDINETFYKPSEIAKKLNVTRQKIYGDINLGILECVKVGQTIRITEQQLLKYLNKGTVKHDK